jgi:hypothetical protein
MWGKSVSIFNHYSATFAKPKVYRKTPKSMKEDTNSGNTSFVNCNYSRIFTKIEMKFYAGVSHIQWSCYT